MSITKLVPDDEKLTDVNGLFLQIYYHGNEVKWEIYKKTAWKSTNVDSMDTVFHKQKPQE